MKYQMNERVYLIAYSTLIKRAGLPRDKRKALKNEYRAIMERAKDIGQKNTLLGSYTLCAFFIAFVRTSGKTPEECYRILEEGVENSKLFKMAFGDAESYLSEKNMARRRIWEKETHEHKYENDWVVDVLGPCDEYDLGYDYTECGVVKLCRDEGCSDLAKYLCRLDFLLSSQIGLDLKRTGTLADGDAKCDFRYSRRKE